MPVAGVAARRLSATAVASRAASAGKPHTGDRVPRIASWRAYAEVLSAGAAEVPGAGVAVACATAPPVPASRAAPAEAAALGIAAPVEAGSFPAVESFARDDRSTGVALRLPRSRPSRALGGTASGPRR